MILMHSILLYHDSTIPPCFRGIDRHQDLFSLALWHLCWLNQSGNVWCSTHILQLCAFRILDAIVSLHIRLNICRAIVSTVICMIQVAIPVKPIFGGRDGFRCAILINFNWMTVDSSDLADIQYLSLSSREVHFRKAGGKGNLSDN